MKKLTSKQLLNRIQGTWENDLENHSVGEIVANVIEGKVISEHKHLLIPQEITSVVIANPTYKITNVQLCQIFDEGNHCLSIGSIVYEDDFAYITWSNLGHI